MKRLFTSLTTCLCIALCAGFLTLSGCTSDSLTGANVQQHETNGEGVGTQSDQPHNEDINGEGVGTQSDQPHNETRNSEGVGTQSDQPHNE